MFAFDPQLKASCLPETDRKGSNRQADRLANRVLDGGELSPLSLPSKDRAKNQAKNRAASVRFRAEVRRGSLHPLEAVELKEGEEVEVEVRRRARDSEPT